MLIVRKWTYRAGITEEFAQEGNDAVNVSLLFNKTQSFAPCQVANDIEGKELEPLTKVAAFASVCVELLGLVQEDTEGGSDQWLIIDQRAHGKSIVDAAAVLCMIIFIGSREERLESAALGNCILNRVEVGLHEGVSNVTRLEPHIYHD